MTFLRYFLPMSAMVCSLLAGYPLTVGAGKPAKREESSRTEHIRYVPGADPATASRLFEARWKSIFVSTPWPDYPYLARRDRIEGRGLLRIYVDESGRVTNVVVLKTTGSRLLDYAGLKAFRQWKARPGPRREVDMPLTFIMRTKSSFLCY